MMTTGYRKRYGLSTLPKQFQADLFGAERAVVQFVEADSLWYIFVLEGANILVQTVKADTLNALFDAFFTSSNQIDGDLNRKLFDLFFGKMYPHIQAKTWTIIPDGRLFFINIEQLQDQKGRYLIEDLQISYQYSASFERSLGQVSKKGTIGAFSPGFSDELKQHYLNDSTQIAYDSLYLQYLQQPFMLQLVTDLSRQYNSSVFTSDLATESNFRNNYHRFQILHFGTHAELDDRDPLRSKLVFAKEQAQDLRSEDGYLHTFEIYGLNLQAELAILSACETAAGDLVDGEGVLSIVRAFQYAGCPSMITSLWQVDEKASAQILEIFYDNLAKNWNKAKALRQAKLEYLKRQKTSQLKAPYYWAGLVLVGDDQPMFLASSGKEKLLIGLGMLVLIIFEIFYRRIWWPKKTVV